MITNVVEYGTGIKGEDRDGYVSNASGKGEDGWFFLDDTGQLRFTHGMKAHRFIFNAVQDYVIGGAYKDIFSSVLSKYIGGIT